MLQTVAASTLVDQHLQDNYRRVRAERGITWAGLAAEFDAQAAAVAGSLGGISGRDDGYRLLATWAREESAAAGETGPEQREGTTPQPASPGPKKRTATPPGPQRTA